MEDEKSNSIDAVGNQQYVDGTALLLYNGDKIVLLLRPEKENILDPNKWSLIGGAIEDGEKPLDTIIRECNEEIGFTPQNIKYLEKSRFAGINIHLFTADMAGNKIKLGEDRSYGFFPIDAALSLPLAFNAEYAIKKYGFTT